VVALDAESVDTPIPPHVAARLPDAAQVDPVAAWTRLEVAAKLTGTPVLLLLTGAIPAPHLDIVTTSVDDIVVSMGRSADDAATSH
jgi:hypothetical protein